jgi:hypothetical protein
MLSLNPKWHCHSRVHGTRLMQRLVASHVVAGKAHLMAAHARREEAGYGEGRGRERTDRPPRELRGGAEQDSRRPREERSGAHYLEDVRTARSQMKRPADSTSLSWRWAAWHTNTDGRHCSRGPCSCAVNVSGA